MTDDSYPTDGPDLGKDGTIPNTDDGIALGHDPDGSHFNPEEDTDENASAEGDGDLGTPSGD
jgi:hypothetical protein